MRKLTPEEKPPFYVVLGALILALVVLIVELIYIY